ncbi:MAG: DUF4384 domain-containing protein [Candidatus Desantisbacteria bacterium]
MKRVIRNGFLAFVCLLLASNWGHAAIKADKEIQKDVLVESYPKKRPKWIDSVPENKKVECFVGISAKYQLEKEARSDALRAAGKEIVNAIGVDVSVIWERLGSDYGFSAQANDPTIAIREKEQQMAEVFFKGLRGEEWYSVKYETRVNNKPISSYWQAYVLVKIPKEELANAREKIEKKIKEDESSARIRIDKAKELVANNDIAQAEPLLKEVIAGLEKIKNKSQEAAGLIAEATDLTQQCKQWHKKIKNMEKQIQDTINQAKQFNKTGDKEKAMNALNNALSIADSIKDYSTSTVSMMLEIEKEKSKIEIKNQLVLKVKEIVRNLSNQPRLQDEEKIKLAIGNITFEDSAAGSSFSRYLRDKITEESLKQEKFSITEISKGVEGLDGELDLLMEGNYWIIGDEVEIRLSLINGQKELIAKESVRVLISQIPSGLSIEPVKDYSEKVKTQVAAFTSPISTASITTDLKVDLWVDKGNGATYQEGEKMQIFAKANKDCYLYLFYKNATGQILQIFPNYCQKDNLVKANQTYVVPDKQTSFEFKITPPFGIEAIKAIASLNPLPEMGKEIKDDDLPQIASSANEFRSRGIGIVAKETGVAEANCVITTTEKTNIATVTSNKVTPNKGTSSESASDEEGTQDEETTSETTPDEAATDEETTSEVTPIEEAPFITKGIKEITLAVMRGLISSYLGRYGAPYDQILKEFDLLSPNVQNPEEMLASLGKKGYDDLDGLLIPKARSIGGESVIDLESPTNNSILNSPFDVKVHFSSPSGIDWSSFKVFYLKLTRFDITESLMPYLSKQQQTLYVPKNITSKNFSKGTHKLLVKIKTQTGQEDELKVTVDVK